MAVDLKLLLASALVLAASGADAAYQPSTYDVFDVSAYGAVGDGTTDNATALQLAFTAASATGGVVRFPCGVFKFSTVLTAYVATNQNLTIQGSGQECTQLYAANANGIIVTLANQFASTNADDFTLVTDQAGTRTGLSIVMTSAPANTSTLFAPSDIIENVGFRGSDLSGAQAKYWNTAFYEAGVSNINFIGGACNGPVTKQGLCYSINGNGAVPFYSVVVNFFGTVINLCGIGIYYGDWFQGMALDAVNITLCGRGVSTVASPAGIPDQLSAVNSQFVTDICAICINDANIGGVTLVNNLITVNAANGVGVIFQGADSLISDNLLAGINLSGTQGIVVGSAFGGGNRIQGNNILHMATGIHVASTVVSYLHIDNNSFDELSGSVAQDYNIETGSSGTVITDNEVRTFANVGGNENILPTCATAIAFSLFTIQDSATSTFDTNVSPGGGDNIGKAFCDGLHWNFH